MIRLSRSAVLLRLCIVAMLLFYVFAGASLALPAAPMCARGAQVNKGNTVNPGMWCPLSLHRHHCHNDQKRTAGKIVLCPDGCLHHESLGGEIPSPAKFLSAPWSSVFAWLPSNAVPHKTQVAPPAVFLPPPHRPPPTSI